MRRIKNRRVKAYAAFTRCYRTRKGEFIFLLRVWQHRNSCMHQTIRRRHHLHTNQWRIKPVFSRPPSCSVRLWLKVKRFLVFYHFLFPFRGKISEGIKRKLMYRYQALSFVKSGSNIKCSSLTKPAIRMPLLDNAAHSCHMGKRFSI